MSCVVCNRDIGKSAEHRECILQLFKSSSIKSISDWIALSTPKTILKGRVLRLLERPTNAGTQSATA